MKKFTILLTLVMIFTLSACGAMIDSITENAVDQISNVVQQDDAYIQGIQNSTINGYSCTYKQAFDNYFSYPTWKRFTSTDGRDIVEFTGECTYMGEPVKAKLQFEITNKQEDGYFNFEPVALALNDVNQSYFMVAALIESVADAY